MSAEYDIATGRLASRGSGFWTFEQATAFFQDWARIVRQTHAAGQPVTAFVDMSDSAVQKADVAELIGSATTGIYREGDAVAMLVPDCLAKMQMRRVLDCRFHEFFISRTAAETWLHGRSRSAATGTAKA